MEYKKVDIKGFEGLYQIDTNGVVYSVPRKGRPEGGVIKHKSVERNGYPFVTLLKEGKQYNFMVHRLLAKAFLPVHYEILEVNHKNGNKEDFSIENLEWSTRSLNEHHSVDVLGKKNATRIRCVEIGEEFTSIYKAAKKFGGCRQNLNAHILGKKKSFLGHTFELLTTP